MRWTPRMEECLRVVGANKECPTDEAFAFQVRLQLLAQRAVQVREQQEVDHAHAATAAAPLPAFLYLKALQGQLQELRGSLSPGLQQQGKWSKPWTEDKVRCSKLLQIIRLRIADTWAMRPMPHRNPHSTHALHRTLHKRDGSHGQLRGTTTIDTSGRQQQQYAWL